MVTYKIIKRFKDNKLIYRIPDLSSYSESTRSVVNGIIHDIRVHEAIVEDTFCGYSYETAEDIAFEIQSMSLSIDLHRPLSYTDSCFLITGSEISPESHGFHTIRFFLNKDFVSCIQFWYRMNPKIDFDTLCVLCCDFLLSKHYTDDQLSEMDLDIERER